MHGYHGLRLSGVWPVVGAPSSSYLSSWSSCYIKQKHFGIFGIILDYDYVFKKAFIHPSSVR